MGGSQNRRTPDPEAKEHRELPVNTALASATDMGVQACQSCGVPLTGCELAPEQRVSEGPQLARLEPKTLPEPTLK